MPTLTNFLPIYRETSATIRARINTDANAGLLPSDQRWIDTREGSFFYDVTQPIVLEFARLWDAFSVEVPAAAFVEFAWGAYLDYHAATFGLARKPESSSSGSALFYGDTASFVQVGAVVATVPAPGGEPIEFVTTQSGVTGTQIAPVGTLTAVPAATGGALAAGTYFYRVTSYNAFGETTGSNEVTATVTGSTSRVTLDWPDVTGATGYRAYRESAAGAPGVRIYDGAVSTVDDIGQAATVTGPPSLNSTGAVILNIQARVAGVEGNVGTGAVSSLDTPITGIYGAYNLANMSGGAEEESDEALRARILLEYAGGGAGTLNDYRRWELARPGIGRVSVSYTSPGQVSVVIMDANGGALSPAAVAAEQSFLDPVAGQGKGQAPAGATVTVSTPTVVPIAVSATITFRTGYSLDGGGGLIAQRARIIASVQSYIRGLDVGEAVVYDHVKAQLFTVQGVYSVADVLVNGGAAASIPITTTPPQIAQSSTVALV